MKLLRCNIVNYGCFHNFAYEFTDGINLINRPNGWGKSTFVSFLCAMLYGLDSTNKRNIQDNERRHYYPWQGGPFGGSLEFEISGRSYRAERFFGKREKEDSFTLYDLKTMLSSQDFSSRLGFELFGIDRAGFLKSICILQNSSAPQYNDSLAARLTGMTESADDINRYENALSAIDKALHFYKKTGNRGEIAILYQELDLTERQAHEALQASKEIDHIYSELYDLEQHRNHLNKRIQSVQKEIELNRISETQARYELLSQQLHQKELELEQAERLFHDSVPEESDIDYYLKSCSELSQILFQIQQQTFDDSQKADFLFLQNLFETPSDSPESEKCTKPFQSNTNDVTPSKSPVLCDSEDIFTPRQKQLLFNSEEYRQKALLLFSPPEDLHSDKTVFLPEHMPDSDLLRQARECFYRYQNLRSSLGSYNQTVSDMISYSKELHNTLEKEQTSISACQQKLVLLEKSSAVSLTSDASSDKTPESESSVYSGRQDTHTSLFALLFLTLISCLIGYWLSPAVGAAAGIAGIFFISLYFFMTSKHPAGRRPETAASVSSSNPSFEEQIIQLKTEIQLRTASCTQLEEQILYQQQKLVSAKEKAHSALLLTDTCKQELKNLSEQLHLPVTESFLTSDEYLTRLCELTDYLKNYENQQKNQYKQYKRITAFYEQLQKKYMDYQSCSQRLKKLEQTVSDLKSDITAYLIPYYSVSASDSPSSLEANLHKLKSELSSYKKLLSDMHLAAQNMNLFFKEHTDFQSRDLNLIDTGLQKHPSRLLSDLLSEEAVLRDQYTNCIKQINSCQLQIRQKQEIAGEYLRLKEQISLLKLKIDRYQERYRLLTLTRQYLVRARQDFTDNYLRSIEKNFNHYAEFLKKELLLNTRMTSDFQILVSDNGVLRETGWYSQGSRDLINLCSRLAIIEDLFPDEKPFLILDDPFVNLDDHSIESLSSILHTISEKWQILYFTCHFSRNI